VRGAALLAYAPRLEPFGYAPLEAAAAGVPTVAVAEGGIRETILDGVTGLLVSRDERDMANAIGRVLGDVDLRTRLGIAANERARRRWRVDDAVARLENELNRVLDNP
ncbi:MAG TPA: glycosyltransferase, partial [Solirubrobacteraceae bacterium]|nr:glycosyltransferase [Solirubrobacteraceae bacterium]